MEGKKNMFLDLGVLSWGIPGSTAAVAEAFLGHSKAVASLRDIHVTNRPPQDPGEALCSLLESQQTAGSH